MAKEKPIQSKRTSRVSPKTTRITERKEPVRLRPKKNND